MQRLAWAFCAVCTLLGLFLPGVVHAQTVGPGATPTALVQATLGSISQPVDGATLRGAVTISGSAAGAWNLSFSYQQSAVETWFLLAQSSKSVSAADLAIWDTRSLTDGLYKLKLSITTSAGTQDIIQTVVINNYTSFETDTPTITVTLPPTKTSTPSPTPQSSLTPALSPVPSITDTPLPVAALPENTAAPIPSNTPFARLEVKPNPAAIGPQDVLSSFWKGVLAVGAVFSLMGLALYLRRN